jgi:hypothetical protein
MENESNYIEKNNVIVDYENVNKLMADIYGYRIEMTKGKKSDLLSEEMKDFINKIKRKHEEDWPHRRVLHNLMGSSAWSEDRQINENDYEGEDSVVNFMEKLHKDYIIKSQNKKEYELSGEDEIIIENFEKISNLFINLPVKNYQEIFDNISDELKEKCPEYKYNYLWYKLKSNNIPDMRLIDKIDFDGDDSVLIKLEKEYASYLNKQ